VLFTARGYVAGMGRETPLRRALARIDPRRVDPVRVIDVTQNAKTVVAGVVAWVLATEVLGLEQAFLAPWAAVLVVHATVFRTVSRAGKQIAGTFIGVFLAWAAVQLLQPSWLAMGAMLVASFLVAIVPWMHDEGTNIGTTGIVVVATNAVAQSNLLTSRLLDTTVGVTVGLAVNLLVWPPLRDKAAFSRVRSLPGELAEIFADIADRLGPDLETSQVDDWVRQCREVDVHIDESWRLLWQAEESSRFNPRRSMPASIEDLTDALHLLEQAVADTLSMARTVAGSAENRTEWGEDFRTRWKALLIDTAEGTRAGDVDRLRDVGRRLGDLAAELGDDELNRAAFLEYGGLLVNLRNISDALASVVEWRAAAGDRPARTVRYAVPSPLVRRGPDGRRLPLARRLPALGRGYQDRDDQAHP
jgi:hypothetical protein